MLVISYNPGYQNLLKSLKPSTRQRFVALSFGYPTPEVEAAILQAEGRRAAELAAQLVKLAQALRRLTDHDLEETVSTRLLVMAARLVRLGPAAGRCLPRRHHRRVDRRRRHRAGAGRGGEPPSSGLGLN
jgi:nitric oxide reductase NorQ protein